MSRDSEDAVSPPKELSHSPRKSPCLSDRKLAYPKSSPTPKKRSRRSLNYDSGKSKRKTRAPPYLKDNVDLVQFAVTLILGGIILHPLIRNVSVAIGGCVCGGGVLNTMATQKYWSLLYFIMPDEQF